MTVAAIISTEPAITPMLSFSEKTAAPITTPVIGSSVDMTEARSPPIMTVPF